MVGGRQPPYQRDGGHGVRQNDVSQSPVNVQSVKTSQEANSISANTRRKTRDRTNVTHCIFLCNLFRYRNCYNLLCYIIC